MTTHQYRLDAEDAVRAKEMGHAEAQPTSETTKRNYTKIARIEAALKEPHGLNLFEAERIGDHCLHTTVAKLRERGCSIHSMWETVPSRYSPHGARCKRYWLTGYSGG